MIKVLPEVIDNSLDEDKQELVLTEIIIIKEIIDELYKNEELEDDIPLD